MSNRRTEMDRLQELVRLHRMGVSSREAARLLGMGRNTERQYRQALVRAELWDGGVSELPELDALKAAVLGASASGGSGADGVVGAVVRGPSA